MINDLPDSAPDGRARLLLVAMRLFAENGFDGVTVRDIAKAAEVSVGLLNHHYGSKKGLRDAVDQHVIEQFEEVLSEDANDFALQEDFSAWLENWIGKHADEWNVSVSYMRRALLEDNEWGSQLFLRFYQIARTSIDRLDAAGMIRSDVDRLWLPLLLVYLELGTMLLEPHIHRLLGKSGYDRELWRRRYTAYLDLFARGSYTPEALNALAAGKPPP